MKHFVFLRLAWSTLKAARTGPFSRKAFLLLAGLLLGLAGTAPARAADAFRADTLIRVAANPARGFQFPYFLLIPRHTLRHEMLSLLVEPNNTGVVNDTLAVHERAARASVAGPHGCLGRDLARELALPLLVPVFPRPARQDKIYTHALDKDALHAAGELRRLDEQLLRMVDDARARLLALGVSARQQVLLNGFSASASFVNRFTLLHPDRVRAVAGGGLNGLLMLPVGKVAGAALPYPLGTADFARLTGHAFALDAYRAVPQFFYMGALDTNDAAAFDDAYDAAERRLIYRCLGQPMLPDRWNFCQQAYQAQQIKARFRTYAGIGHATDMRIFNDLKAFFAAYR